VSSDYCAESRAFDDGHRRVLSVRRTRLPGCNKLWRRWPVDHLMNMDYGSNPPMKAIKKLRALLNRVGVQALSAFQPRLAKRGPKNQGKSAKSILF
jgi:hypothetical protein